MERDLSMIYVVPRVNGKPVEVITPEQARTQRLKSLYAKEKPLYLGQK